MGAVCLVVCVMFCSPPFCFLVLINSLVGLFSCRTLAGYPVDRCLLYLTKETPRINEIVQHTGSLPRSKVSSTISQLSEVRAYPLKYVVTHGIRT